MMMWTDQTAQITEAQPADDDVDRLAQTTAAQQTDVDVARHRLAQTTAAQRTDDDLPRQQQLSWNGPRVMTVFADFTFSASIWHTPKIAIAREPYKIA